MEGGTKQTEDDVIHRRSVRWRQTAKETRKNRVKPRRGGGGEVGIWRECERGCHRKKKTAVAMSGQVMGEGKLNMGEKERGKYMSNTVERESERARGGSRS
jgi:hypothetical protein